MTGRLAPAMFTILKIATVLLTIQILTVSAMRYLTASVEAPGFILGNAFANPFLLPHVVGGMVALLIGPLQLAGPIRRRWPRLHRTLGTLYVAAVALAAPAGLMLGLGTEAGPVAGAGFAVSALLWPLFTGLAVRAAIQRRFAAHRAWMLRSYAITATAITLRLMLPASAMLQLDFIAAYAAIAWLSWLTNLALMEAYLRRAAIGAASGAGLQPA